LSAARWKGKDRDGCTAIFFKFVGLILKFSFISVLEFVYLGNADKLKLVV